MLEILLVLAYCVAFFLAPVITFSAFSFASVASGHRRRIGWGRLAVSATLVAICVAVFELIPQAETAGWCGLIVFVLTSVILLYTALGAPRA